MLDPSEYENDGMEYVDETDEAASDDMPDSESAGEADGGDDADAEAAADTGADGDADAPAGAARFAAPKTSLAARTKGVVYLSRVPTGMTPTLLRGVLSDVGPVGRMYLKAKEVKGTKDQKRKQRQRRLYSEGWIEFLEKKHAKKAALLNCTPVGGSRRSIYAHELWNIKYLQGVTWSDIKDEQIIKKEYMKREVDRVKREGLKQAEDFRRRHLAGETQQKRPQGGRKNAGAKRKRDGSGAPTPKRRNAVFV